jgi:hypothetical protein
MDRREIAEKIPCDLHTVGHWTRQWEREQSLEEKEGRGRKRKADEYTDAIVNAAKADPHHSTPRQLIRQLRLPLSHDTVRRRLDEHGLFGRVSREEHPFTPLVLIQRIAFGNDYANWTVDQWNHVLWSDECAIPLGPSGQRWVQRPRGAAYDPQYMTRQRTHPPTVAIWACMSGLGVGECHVYTGSMDAQLYRSFLSMHLLPSAFRLFGNPPGQWYYQQDNPNVHKSSWFEAEWD